MTNAQNPTVLIVEDTQDVANIILIALRKLPINMVHVTNGQDAIVRARELTPALIILDIGLPGIDGWQVLDVLQDDEKLAHVPVAVITAYSDAENRQTGKLYGVYAYLPKPVTPQQLRETVQRALGLT